MSAKGVVTGKNGGEGGGGAEKRSPRTRSFSFSGSFGKQVITFPGSLCLNVNNILGPAIVAYPLIFAQSGWLLPSVVLVVVCVLSAFSSTMLCEAMQRIPGNHGLTKRYEYTSTVRHYWGHEWYVASQIMTNVCLQALNIASIIVAVQVMDELFVYFFGETAALQYLSEDGNPTLSVLTSTFSDLHDLNHVISAGFVVCLLVCLPFGMMNLDENMWFQWFSFAALFISTAMFAWDYLSLPLHTEWVPAMNPGLDSHAQVLGVIVFSYAFVITVPSWVNEKKPSVSTNKSIWWSCIVGMLIKLGIGYLAAITYPNLRNSANILQVMNDSRIGGHEYHRFTRWAVYMFNFGTIVPGIPIFSILVRYNLLTGKVCGPKFAFFYSFVLPWAISAFMYRGRGFQNLINWSAVLLQGFVNFTIPALLYVSALKRYPSPNNDIVLLDEEEDAYLLKEGDKNGGHDSGSGTPEKYFKQLENTISEKDETQDDVNAVPHWLARYFLSKCLRDGEEKDIDSSYENEVRFGRVVFGYIAAGIMTCLVLMTLGLDLYFFFAKGEDIVDE